MYYFSLVQISACLSHSGLKLSSSDCTVYTQSMLWCHPSKESFQKYKVVLWGSLQQISFSDRGEQLSGSAHNTILFCLLTVKTCSLGWEIPCLTSQLLWTKISLTSKSKQLICFHLYHLSSVSKTDKPQSHCLPFTFFFFLKGVDWSQMTRSSLKTNTKPCESCILGNQNSVSSVMHSVKILWNQIRDTLVIHTPLLPSWHC